MNSNIVKEDNKKYNYDSINVLVTIEEKKLISVKLLLIFCFFLLIIFVFCLLLM